MIIAYVIIQVTILAALINGASRNQKFLYWAAFIVPLGSLRFQWAVGLSWELFIFPLSLLVLLTRRHPEPIRSFTPLRGFTIFLGYSVLLTIIMTVVDANGQGLAAAAAAPDVGVAQSTYRQPLQMIAALSTWGILITGFIFTRRKEEAGAAVCGYIDGNLLNVVIGVYQLAAFRLGLPWLSGWFVMDTLGQDFGRGGVLMGGGAGDIYRLSGLGGEPKQAGAHMALAVVLLLSCMAFSVRESRWEWVRAPGLKLVILTLGTILTLSSSSWVGVILGSAITLSVWAMRPGKGRAKVTGIVMCVGIVLAFLTTQDIGRRLFEDRISGRFQNRDTVKQYDPKNSAFIMYATEHPLDLIVGLGWGGVEFRLRNYVPWGERSVLTPSSALLQLLGAVGLFGLLILTAVYLRWLSLLWTPRLMAFAAFTLAGAGVVVAASSVVLPAYLLLSGVLVGFAVAQRQPTNRMRKRGPQGGRQHSDIASTVGVA